MSKHRYYPEKNTPHTENLISQRKAIEKYGVTKNFIDKYFPKPAVVKYGKNYQYMRLWKEEDIVAALSRPDVKAMLDDLEASRQRDRDLAEARTMFMNYTPDYLVEKAKHLKRVFILHVGPTNSGKTYNAIEALKRAGDGVYLGPLRLLALEMFDKLNAAGIKCSLLTGEESIPTEGATAIASTIELCDTGKHYSVAIIDEAQLIADDERGSSWLRAICAVNADEVHICLAPEALGYIESLVSQFGDPYTVVQHERLVPLVYSGRCKGYEDVQPGDAVICFSRKNVLSTAAYLERAGFKASVIYGALPPAARRNEVSKYTSGETNVIVATDAIGMGISLPIRRIVFAETDKFDGRSRRPLLSGEVRQIAGRAGRYGMFDLGEVLTMTEDDIIKEGLETRVLRVRTPCIGFPREALDTRFSLDVLLRAWQTLPLSRAFKREDMTTAIALLSMLKDNYRDTERELVFSLITCPIDKDNRDLTFYWLRCARAILRARRVPDPDFDIDTLEGCELQYKAWDVNHQLKTRIGRTDDTSAAKREAICKRIGELMAKSKEDYIISENTYSI